MPGPKELAEKGPGMGVFGGFGEAGAEQVAEKRKRLVSRWENPQG
jgi:hypothetical protein